MSSNIDLLVLTYNEEPNLEYCLRSVQGLVQNIFIVDSGSIDRTVEIAHQYDAQVVTHPFTNQAQQFNWALDNLPIQTEWILRLDADEFLGPELKKEILEVLPTFPETVTGLYIKRRVYFKGRWIRYGGYYPTWLLRLFRRGKARSEQLEMDEHIVVLEGETRRLKNDFIDYNRKDLAFWTNKHENFAGREALVLMQQYQVRGNGKISGQLLGDQAERKRWLKDNLYLRLPLFFRAFAYFFYRYFLRLGFLDGTQGLIFHVLQCFWYRFYVDAKIWERRHVS